MSISVNCSESITQFLYKKAYYIEVLSAKNAKLRLLCDPHHRQKDGNYIYLHRYGSSRICLIKPRQGVIMLRRLLFLCIALPAFLYAAPEKIKIAVLPFSFNTAMPGYSMDKDDVASGLTDKLQVAIAELGRFDVVERAQLNNLLGEQALTNSGVVNEEMATKVGNVSGSDVVVLGAINLYSMAREQNDEGKYYYKSNISMSIRFIDPETGVIEKANQVQVSGKGSSSSDARFKAVSSAINRILGKIRELYPLEAQIASVNEKQVTVNMGSAMGIKKGQYFAVVRTGEAIVDQSTGQFLGEESRKVGMIKITETHQNYARAKVVKAEEPLNSGDVLKETKARTRIGITGGYAYGQVTGKIGEPVDIPYRNYQTGREWWDGYEAQDTLKDTALAQRFDEYDELATMQGGYVALEFLYIKNSNMSTSLLFSWMGADDINAFNFDLRIGYEFPLANGRVRIPLGAGVSFGAYNYSIDYVQHLQSHLTDYRVAVRNSTASNIVSAGTVGAIAFSGLRIFVHEKVCISGNVGYRINTSGSEWSGTYKVDKWNSEERKNEEVDEDFDIDQKYLPYRDVQLMGLDVRAGVSFVF